MPSSGRNLRPHHASSSAAVPAVESDLRLAFDVLDVDRDGKISRNDLRWFYAGVCSDGMDINDDVIGTMMTVADTNEDGLVDYEEFECVVMGSGRRRPLGYGVMEEVFRVMDRDGDGKLCHEDLKSYMAQAGFPATEEDITVMIKLGGGDQNGGVSLDGLLCVLGLHFVG